MAWKLTLTPPYHCWEAGPLGTYHREPHYCLGMGSVAMLLVTWLLLAAF